MNSTLKNTLFFIAGLFTGVVLMLGAGAAFMWTQHNETFMQSLGLDNHSHSDEIEGLEMFHAPGDVVPGKRFVVFQVLGNFGALARAEEMVDYSDMTVGDTSDDFINDVIVFFPKKGNTSYYDEQVIKLPQEKCLKQIGVFKYETNSDILRTVPVVGIYDKE